MAELNLKSVNYNLEKKVPSYVISSVVDCEYGYDGPKLISSPEELDKYYQGLENREGLLMLLNSGASVYLNKLNNFNSRTPTLRLLDNNFKYAHPLDYSKTLYESSKANELIQGVSPDNITLHETFTYNYVLDFGTSDLEDEDYIAIPTFNEENPDSDNSSLFYFTDLSAGNLRKFPNDFSPPVSLGSLGSKSLGITLTQDSLTRDIIKRNRAKIIYQWYLGILDKTYWETMLGIPKVFDFTGEQGDPNLINELCELDEDNNKLTLVFKNPIRNINYWKSNSLNSFTIGSDRYLNQELICDKSQLDSVLSFKSKIKGDIDLTIVFRHLKNYLFELDISSDEENEYHYVSLDENETLYNGRSLFIDDVINRDSLLVESICHLGTRVEATDQSKFTIEQAKSLEGTYYIAYGTSGDNLPKFINGELVYPYMETLNQIIESDIYPNLFLFENSYLSLSSQEYIVENFLEPNNIVGLVNISNVGLQSSEDILLPVIEDSYRSNLLYTFGTFTRDGGPNIDISYLYALHSTIGKFNMNIPEKVLPSKVSLSDKSYLDDNYINYLNKNKDFYFIDQLVNLPEYLEPVYLIISNYIQLYMSRFLETKLGLYGSDIREIVESELPKITTYNPLISRLYLDQYIIQGNNLNITLKLELTELLSKEVSVIIEINKS